MTDKELNKGLAGPNAETPSDLDVQHTAKATAEANSTPKTSRSFNSSAMWALLFLVLIGGWLLSGDLVIGGRDHANEGDTATQELANGTRQKASEAKAQPFRVRVATLRASPREAKLVLRGRTEVEARVQVRAETAGMIIEIPVKKGALIKKGDLLCRLDEGARKANLLEATAKVDQALSTYNATKKLEKRGYAAKLKSHVDRASLDAARAALERAELDLDRTTLESPIGGVVEDKPARIGDYLMVGGACVTLVRMDPLLVIGAVSERDVAHLKPGMTADVRLITGQSTNGQIRFISPTADAKTRTFRVEVVVANAEHALRDGITADITVALQSTDAHRLSPSILALSDTGDIGVRLVDADNRVRFVPVKILSDDRDGVWVAGLPETVRVIMVGQEYVVDGQLVTPVEAAETAQAGAPALH